MARMVDQNVGKRLRRLRESSPNAICRTCGEKLQDHSNRQLSACSLSAVSAKHKQPVILTARDITGAK